MAEELATGQSPIAIQIAEALGLKTEGLCAFTMHVSATSIVEVSATYEVTLVGFERVNKVLRCNNLEEVVLPTFAEQEEAFFAQIESEQSAEQVTNGE